MSTTHDPHAVVQPSKSNEAPQHEPRTPGGETDHPNKPFRTPSKNKTHPAPERGTDGEPGQKPE